MLDPYLLIDVIVIVALAILALAALIKASSVKLNRIFAYFALSIAVWIIANYISNDVRLSPHIATAANYFVFSFGYAAGIFLLRFSVKLADDKKASRIFNMAQPLLFLLATIGATPLVVRGVHTQGTIYAVDFGPLAMPYFVTLPILIGAAMYVAGRNIRKSHGSQKRSLQVLFRGMCWTFPTLLLAQAIIPATTGWFGLTNIGVTPMLILVFSLYYSVVKHRLFDLRLLVVRSLAYVLTLGLISVVYGVITHYALTILDKLGYSTSLKTLVNIVLIITVVLAYAPLRRSFNQVTNRFFYRDAYDVQQFFNKLNQTLVADVDMSKLLRDVSILITSTLKSQYCVFMLRDRGTRQVRLIGSAEKRLTISDADYLDQKLIKVEQDVIATDYLSYESESLRNALSAKDVAVIARMMAVEPRRFLGYLILGPKNTGNVYNKQDIHVIEALNNGLVIAVLNALRFEEIQRFNITLQEEVDDATRKLRQTNQKLLELDEAKDDFISMASHQLRTPLTSVKGYISMVLDGDAGKINRQQRKMLQQAFSSSQRMVYLITDLLNISRLRTGKFVIDATPTDLAQLTQQEVIGLQEAAKLKKINLSYHKPAHFPELMLDEVKTRQVIMNFIDNALYYTPTGGNVRVELNDKPSAIELRVIDNGIGVPRAEQHHLFTKFYRAGNARKARPDGTGLGLFMAKKVITAQGGATIFSSREGQGSTFGFVFSKSHLRVQGNTNINELSPQKVVVT